MDTAQKIKFSIKEFFSKCDQIRLVRRIWSHLLKKSLMENFIFWCSESSSFICVFGKLVIKAIKAIQNENNLIVKKS